MQVREPVGRAGVGMSADDITDVGAGTMCKKNLTTLSTSYMMLISRDFFK